MNRRTQRGERTNKPYEVEMEWKWNGRNQANESDVMVEKGIKVMN